MNTHLEDLKARVDTLAIMSGDIGQPSKKTGRWYSWPCPFHQDWSGDGGSLKFTADTGTWHCFGCGRSGDVLSWLTTFRKMAFTDAVRELEGMTGLQGKSYSQSMNGYKTVEVNTPPPADWQEKAARVVDTCHTSLLGNEKAQQFIQSERGITLATQREFHLGINKSVGMLEGLYILAGVTIPWLDPKTMLPWRVKIWRINPPDGEKYKWIKGANAKFGIFGRLTGKKDCFVVEGEFDAILLWQEIGDLADVVTLGAAASKLDDRWLPMLLPMQRVWIATDNDEAGGAAAKEWLGVVGDKGERVLPPRGYGKEHGKVKDVTDSWRAGVNLREWAVGLMADAQSTPQQTKMDTECLDYAAGEEPF